MSDSSEWSCLHIDLLNALSSAERSYQELCKTMNNYIPTGLNQTLSPRVEKTIVFRNETQSIRMTIILLSCSLIEAYINFYLSLKTNSDQFSALERLQLLDKWLTVPSLFLPHYKIDKSTQLYNDLSGLVEHRNRLIHTKPLVIRDGKLIHKGYSPKRHNSEHELILHYISLPLRLLKHLAKFESDDIKSSLAISSGYPSEKVLPSQA